ncbi:MAG TPA: LLM class flavin-dependent oxidoreductase, partial [Ilumatobacteraceae bacterium]
MRFQVLSLPSAPWDELVERFVRLDEMGIEVGAIADHFVDWTKPTNPWLESWTLLAGIAASTTRIRLTTCVSQIPLRNPAMLARQALTLDHISHGRIEVGLGTGITVDPSYDMIGIPNWEPRERVARFGEYVTIVGQLLANEVSSFSGKHYAVSGAVMNPRPVQSPRPPIMVAAMGPAMIRHAASSADIWNSMSFDADFDSQLSETAIRIAAADAACHSIGREPRTLQRSYTMFDATARPRGGTIGYYESADLFVE